MIYALIQNKPLPLSFINDVIPDPGSWNGLCHNYVYVKPKLFRKLHELQAPEKLARYHNAWEYYFIGCGVKYLSLEAALSYLANSYHKDDWTFQDGKHPIPNLSHLQG